MQESKSYIWHVMLCEFKNNKNITEIAKNICSVYGQSVITDCQVENWFSKIHFNDMSLKDEPKPGRSLYRLRWKYFKIGGMQSIQKYSRISNWPNLIPIHNLPPPKNNRKMSIVAFRFLSSPDGDTDYFDIVAGVLQGHTLAPYLFIICLDYVPRTSIDKIKENVSSLQRKEAEGIPHKQLSTPTTPMT